MVRFVILTIVMLLCSHGISFAQERKLVPSQQLSISEGLPHNGVTSIIEDSQGYLWIGSYDGLARYDGFEVKVFKNTLDNNLLVSNRVRTLAEDDKGNIWIGADEGITIYDSSREKFKIGYANRLANKGFNGPIVRKILINKKKKQVVCATEGNGILVFKDDTTFLHQYVPPLKDFGNNVLFYDGIDLDGANYIFSTSLGLVQFNIESHEFGRVLPNDINLSNSILDIGNNTLLATGELGIITLEYKPLNGRLEFTFRNKTLESYRFKTAGIDQQGRLWLGTIGNGVLQINNVTAIQDNVLYEKSTYVGTSGALRISCIVPTEHGCWVGTFNQGVFRFDSKENPFRVLNAKNDPNHGLVSNSMMIAAPLDVNRVYISSASGGIALFNTKTLKFEPLRFDLPKKYALRVGYIFVDSRKNLWILLTDVGLFRVRAGSRIMEKIDSALLPILKNLNPHSIMEDKNGNIWIGATEGLYKVDLNFSGKVVSIENLNNNPFFKKNKISLVRDVYLDPLFNYVWVGTGAQGLIRINIQDHLPLDKVEIEQYLYDKDNKFSLPSNFVSTIIRLPNGELWLGTEGGGICKVYKSETFPSFLSFSEKQGLSNNVVKGILNDNGNNLWVATNIGLNKFDTKDFRFRNFSKEDGVPFEDFWYTAVQLGNGLYLFGGVDGLCYFDPKNISYDETLPKLQFGELTIYNQPLLPGDTLNDRVLYNKRLMDGSELHLKYNENVFSVEVLSLHFSNLANHHLKYRLSPLYTDWAEVNSSQKRINYSGLKPGDYVLEVAASNSLNVWTPTKKLMISISPPFWKTSFAYFIYTVLLIMFLATALYFILKIQSLRHNVQLEQLEKDTQKRINTEKLRFFSNISHEIKTPITLISGPIDILVKRFRGNFDVQEKLQLVQRQSKKISQLLEQVQDFQRADHHLLKMDYTRFYFDTFINNLLLDFEFMAKNDSKKLEVQEKSSKIIVSADMDKLEKIFNNILNNAFKYTGTNDVIKIIYGSDEKDLIVTISDTGKGIDKEDLPHIFERFYRARKNQNEFSRGSGIGLAFTRQLVEMHYGYIKAESELGKGTTITVRLPVVKAQQAEDLVEKEQVILTAENDFIFSNQIEEIKRADYSNIKADDSFSDALVFFAEDNLEMRKFVAGMLTKFFKVRTFRNGKECLDAMENQWPDIVISDVQMPEMNGLDLCKRIKSDIKTSHIPVILLTALINIDDQIQGIRDGADAYIKKPFNVQHLIARTEALLINRKQLRERFNIEIPLTKESNINNRNDNAFLEKLYELMAENLDNQDLDINEFSKKLFLNRTHFYQKVKALTNQTPFALLKMYRLNKAAEFLVQKRLSVNEVYLMTGFKSRTHFTKLFKEKYGTTPGKYASEASKKYS